MKTNILRATAIAAIALSGTVVAGQAYAASASGSASATIATPVSISETTALSFGTILADDTASSTIVVSSAGARSVGSGSAQLLGGTVSNAAFSVSGESGATYTISYTAGSLTGPGTAMAVDTFTDDTSSTGTLTGGSDTFNVGATLTVGANQTAGSYSGSYTVTVNYQ